MGQILLTDNPYRVIGTEMSASYYRADLFRVYQEGTKAQLKRVVELLQEKAHFIEWEWKDSEGIWEVFFDNLEWQALIKEVEG